MRLRKPTTLGLVIAALVAIATTVGATRSNAQADDPFGQDPGPGQGGTAVEPITPSAPASPVQVEKAPAAAPPATAPKKAPVSSPKKQEVLPWTNVPKTSDAAAPTGDPAAAQAASAQCTGLFEAACRDLKTCAWIAEFQQEDGTLSPARCLARPPAPPKKAAKTPAAPAKPKKTSETIGAAPAVKSSETGAPETAAPKETKTTTPKSTATEDSGTAASAPVKSPEAKKGPIVVTSPSAPSSDKPAMPSFGSVPNAKPDGDNAVVVTVPSQQ